MVENQKVQTNVVESNSSSKSSAGEIEEGIKWLKIESSDEQNNAGNVANNTEGVRLLKIKGSDDQNSEIMVSSYPDRPGEPDCIYFLRTGKCGYGSNCRFNHPLDGGKGVENVVELPERVGQPDCGYFLKTGTCKYGETCKYHHPKDRHNNSFVMLNVLGLPMRQDEKPCSYYMRNGSCKYGYACKFDHPQPANPLPLSGSMMNSSSAAFPVVPSGTELGTGAYMSSPLLQAPQGYMPVYYSPSQGWNMYTGNLSPFSATSFLPEPVSEGQSSAATHLPERPNQPECRYFLNNGNCKYGSGCKFHHPKEKVAQFASNVLGPMGLPLRPGQPLCSYYAFYGLCKYGPTCRFDHPLDRFSYSYSFNAASLPPVNSPFIPYPAAPLAPLPETSASKTSKFTGWIKKGGTSQRNGHASDQSKPVSHSSGGSSEHIQNEPV